VFGKRERVLCGVEDVRVEEVDRIAGKLMRHPRDRPFDQEGVAVIVAGQRAGIGGQRPRVSDGERCKKQKHRDVRATQDATGQHQNER
jgi:hypothetical protein